MGESQLPAPTTALPDFPARDDHAHKGNVGRVAIIAGSRGMTGAAVLCGLGALRGGAGLVRVHTPESAYPIVAASEPCLMVRPMRELQPKGVPLPEEDFQWADVFAIGPGLGEADGVATAVLAAAEWAKSLVIDADGLNALASFEGRAWRLRDKRTGRATVVTPHPGEMARLRSGIGLPELRGTDDDTRLRIAHEYAEHSGATVVLKGHRTVVCTADQAYINTTGNSGMATGGMGDVLTGLIAALLGQGLSAFDAARLGVHVHGAAGDEAARRIGPVGFTARDVAALIPGVLGGLISSPIGFHNR